MPRSERHVRTLGKPSKHSQNEPTEASSASIGHTESRKSLNSERSAIIQIKTVQVSVFTFRKLFQIVAEPVWYASLMIANYLAIIWVIYGSLDSKCLHSDKFGALKINEFIYGLDVLYFFDIMIVLVCKHISGFELDETNKIQRPTWILSIEIVSVLPFELCSSTTEQERMFCLLKLIKVLRFVRIIHFYFQKWNFIDINISLRLIGMISVEVLIIMLAYSVYCNASCYSSICEDDACNNFDAIVALTACLTSSGFNTFPDTPLWNILTTVLLCLTFYCVQMLTTCDIALEFIDKHVEKELFVSAYSNVVQKCKRWKSPKFVKGLTHSYFNTVWNLRYGYSKDELIQEELPNAFKLDMVSDVYWEIFRHSHMFRHRSKAFLREVSTIVKPELKLPGDMIWSRDQWKTKMIYVVHGIIQLLSEEDGDSPVLALTSGTCIGDSCLITSYKSRTNVRCKGFCKLYTIDKSDFGRIYKKFPQEYKIVLVDIQDRYRNARDHLKLALLSKAHLPPSKLRLDTYSLLWMKNTLHKHMAHDEESIRRHKFQNIYLLNETKPSDLKRVLFTADYLDTLAIAERLEFDTDSVFLKPSFPCVLQPDCFLVTIWEVFIICVTVFTTILVPRQACMYDEEVPWFIVVLNIITFTFLLDIGVQLSIGVVTRETLSAKFYDIARVRMGTWGFLFDVISCFPLEIIKSIACKDLSTQTIALLYLNRLLKGWRIAALFNEWEKRFGANFLLIHTYRYFAVLSYSIFFFYCLLNRIRSDMDHHELFLISVQLVTNSGISPMSTENGWLCVAGNLFANVLHLVMIAHFISGLTLLNLSRILVRQYSEEMQNVLNIIPRFWKYINEHLYTQWQDNRCESITSRFYSIPESLHRDMLLHLAKEKVETLPLFALLPREIVRDIISNIFKYRIFSPNELIVKCGDIEPNAFMVYGGVTEVMSPDGELHLLDSSTYMVNFTEASLGAQSATTVICTTHCKAFYFHIDEFKSVLRKYAFVWNDYKQVVETSYDLKLKTRSICENEHDIGLLIREGRVGKSWVTFSRNLKKDSYAEYDYHIPFDKLYPFNFVRHFMLKTIFLPDGKFFIAWESIKCACAILTCILFFCFPIISEYCGMAFILDMISLVDIYVRLHVAYYNSKGVLITHPTKTANHYITHSFIVDLLGSLPLSYFTQADAFGYFSLNFVRLAQLYRYINFIRYLRRDPTKRISKWVGVMYVPLACIVINLFGSVLVTLECVQEIGALMCKEGVMIATSNTHWFSDIYIHISGVFVAGSAFLGLSMGVYQIRSKLSVIVTSVICVLGVYFKSLAISHFITMYSFRNNILNEYQDEIHSLKKFLVSMKVDKKLKMDVIYASELQWKNQRSRDVIALTDRIPGTLRIDMIYDYYGEELFLNSIFTSKRRSFYRNLVSHIKDKSYPKGGYVTTINDISKAILILFHGSVDVLAADGTVFNTIWEGSIFGNLEYSEYSRIKCSIVANSNIRVLSIPSKVFYDLLHHYPKMNEQFVGLKWKYMTYIPAFKETPKKEQDFTIPSTPSTMAHIKAKLRAIFLNMVHPHSKLVFIWKLLTLSYSCYLAILLNFYQIGAMEFSYTMLAMQYISDILYLFHLIGKYFSPYIDENGILITDATLIKIKQSRKKKWYALQYISILPIDLPVILFMTTKPYKYYLFALFRLNRLIRFAYVVHYFKVKSHQLNGNIVLVKFCYNILWVFIILLGMASFFAFLSCATPAAILPLLPTCEMLCIMSAGERWTVYVKYLSMTCHFFTFSGQHVYTPQSRIILLLCILYSVFSLYIYAVIYSKIFAVVRDASSQRYRFRKLGSRLKKYMLIEDASISLVDRVVRYVELLWFNTRGIPYPTLLRDAPEYLQEAILFDAYYTLIGGHPIFEHCHFDFIRQVVQKTKTERYFYDEYIQFKGIIQGTMYFIFKGSVKVVDERDDHDFTMKTLQEGESFGIIEGLTGNKKHDYTFQVDTSAVIVSLTLRDWDYLLDFFPASKEKIFNVAKYYIGAESIL